MQILYNARRPSIFPGSYSEVYTYGQVIQLLKERLGNHFALYVKHGDGPYQLHLIEQPGQIRIMIHISNEIEILVKKIDRLREENKSKNSINI